jgi:hypothetical protein
MLPFPLGKCWNERMVWADMFIIKSKWGGGGIQKKGQTNKLYPSHKIKL